MYVLVKANLYEFENYERVSSEQNCTNSIVFVNMYMCDKQIQSG